MEGKSILPKEKRVFMLYISYQIFAQEYLRIDSKKSCFPVEFLKLEAKKERPVIGTGRNTKNRNNYMLKIGVIT